MFTYRLLILLISFQFIYSEKEEIKAFPFNSKTFPDEIAKGNVFVMFYAPWCGHCQRLEPTWNFLAEMFNEENDIDVRIGRVDCTVEKDICSQEDVTGYPTLKIYKRGSTEGVKFKGTRELKSLVNFIDETLNLGSIPSSNGEEKNESSNLDTVNGLTELTEDTFDKHISSGKHFVKFYAPWCGHCQKLAPTWEKLAQSLEHDKTIGISKVDCTLHRSVCNQFDIKGYPTLLWIEDGKKIDKYQGQRSHDDLKTYVTKMAGSSDVSSDDQEPSGESPSSVLILTGDDFEQGILKGVSFVKFFAPWCGHCKRLAPTWEDLGKKFLSNSAVNIAKVDCTMESSKQLCGEQEVDGFPTLFIYKNGEKVSEYQGSRTLEDLHEFVTKHGGGGGRDEL